MTFLNTGQILWAFNADTLIRMLAVVGAFTLGALVGGFFFRMIARDDPKQPHRKWMSWIVRSLTGFLFGYVTALVLFGGGGFGLGGSGGFGFGSGTGSGTGEKDSKDALAKNDKDKIEKEKKKTPPKDKSGSEKGDNRAQPIEVEVLGDAPLKTLAQKGKTSGDFRERRYRLRNGDGNLRTLSEVKEIIRQRMAETPPLRKVVIVIYRDSPAGNTFAVTGLERWAKDLDTGSQQKLTVDVLEPGSYAPLE